MSSFEKLEKHHNKKKYIFKGGNYLLSPINNKKINSLNYFSLNKRNNDIQSKKGIFNKINNTEQYQKKNDINLEQLNNKIIINKRNALSRPKNLNQMHFYTNANNSYLNSAKNDKKYDNNLTTDDLKKNIIVINNNTYNLKKLYINKKNKELNYYSNNDSFSNQKNCGSNIQSYEYIKTNINNTPNKLNLQLLFPNQNIFEKKIYNDIIGTPSGLYKKNSHLNFKMNSFRNIMEKYNNYSNIKINPNKKLKKVIDSPISAIKLLEKKYKIIKDKCPEELHFYYIRKIQKGKRIEKELDGE